MILINLDLSSEEIDKLAYRASHYKVCGECGKTYIQHPFLNKLDHNDEPYLNVICNGDIVKL